jgi:uncharacterized membrane protein (DUF2068 family)
MNPGETDPRRALQLLTIAYLVLCGMSIATGLAMDDLLPEPLREWSINAQDFSGAQLLTLGVLVMYAIGALIAGSIGLLRMKYWGAWLHLSSSLTGFVMLPMYGPIVQHPLTSLVDGLGVLVAGCLYGVAFFSTALTGKDIDSDA